MSGHSRRVIAKYAAFAALGFRQARAEPGELLGRVLFFGLILGVFSAVWRAVAETGASVQRDPREMLWYLAITEWVVLSAPMVQRSEEHTSELQSQSNLVCRLLLEKK